MAGRYSLLYPVGRAVENLENLYIYELPDSLGRLAPLPENSKNPKTRKFVIDMSGPGVLGSEPITADELA